MSPTLDAYARRALVIVREAAGDAAAIVALTALFAEAKAGAPPSRPVAHALPLDDKDRLRLTKEWLARNAAQLIDEWESSGMTLADWSNKHHTLTLKRLQLHYGSWKRLETELRLAVST